MRFQKNRGANPNSTNAQEHLDNKTKIEMDSTTITNPQCLIKEVTTQGQHYPEKNKEAKSINTPLHPFVANNIRTTHYEIGPGGQARPTEQRDSFADTRGCKTARFSLSNDRIDFFKQSHFVIGSEGEGRVQLRDKTFHKSALPEHPKDTKKQDPTNCSAF
jgi:hypothetical protein